MDRHAPDDLLRLLTLNLWGTNGPVRRRLDHLVAYLAAARPDVVALQEVRRVDGRRQTDLLAEAAGYDHVHDDRTWGEDAEEEGLGVLSRIPITPLAPTPLPGHPRDVPRQLQRVELDLGHGSLLLGNTHLTFHRHTGGVRLEQARRIRDVILEEGRSDRPTVLVGDLNTSRRSRAVRLLEAPPPYGAGLHDAHAAAHAAALRRPAVTFSFTNPFARQFWLLGRRVDHILVSDGLEAVDAATVLTGSDHPVVSDHYGVRAVLAPIR